MRYLRAFPVSLLYSLSTVVVSLDLMVLMQGCVRPPSRKEAASPEEWITLEPGAARTYPFSQGALTFVTLSVPAGAVREPATLHFSIPATQEPIFPGTRIILLTPVVQIEPVNFRFQSSASLNLRWLKSLPGTDPQKIYGFRSLTLPGLKEGNWVTTAIELFPEVYIALTIPGGGLYFAGIVTQGEGAPATILGDPCADAAMDGAACTGPQDCRISGCDSQWCGYTSTPQEFLCLPDRASLAREGCACGCFQKRCLWIR